MLTQNTNGGYAFVPKLAFASAGVVALPGMSIARARFEAPQHLDKGFERVRRHIENVGRPLAALCGLELRMPKVLSFGDFEQFNETYMAPLRAWGLLHQGRPTLTRTNVVPTANPPSDGSIIAFSYTLPAPVRAKCFVISGIPEISADSAYPEGVLRPREASVDALAAKTLCAVEAVSEFVSRLGAVWDSGCLVHLYSKWPLAQELGRVALSRYGIFPAHGIVWHDADPPVPDLALEIDVRRYSQEMVIAAD